MICPGLYCGVLPEIAANSSFEIFQCGACPRGWRRNVSFVCEPCSATPTLYDWLYLGFNGFIPWILHSFFIEFSIGPKSNLKILSVQHLSAAIECLLAFLFSLLVIPPYGRPWFETCGVAHVQDWYTVFYNPSIDYTKSLHCSQEAVYPLYTQPFIYFCFCLIAMGILRSLMLLPFDCKKTGACTAVYAALYFLPVTTLVHAVMAGVIYYSFPYIVIVGSLLTNAVYLALYEHQSAKGLVLETFQKTRNVAVLLAHCLVFAYGIISITTMRDVLVDSCLLALVFLPSLLYAATSTITDPHKLSAFNH